MKKRLSIFLALSLSASALAGCTSSGDNNSAAGTDSKSGSGTSSSSSGAKVKLTAIMLKHPLTQELSKMKWLQDAMDRAGVDIQWQEISADWGQKKGTLLASGDIPDFIIGSNAITDADLAQFQGLFQDLNALIDKDAPNVQNMFKEVPETKGIVTQLDGKIYGLPKYQRFWPATATRQFINQKWLNDLGLNMPTTWDELFDVLKAFKEKIPGSIPMDFSPVGTGGFGFFQPTVMLGSEGITLTDGSGQGVFVEDGKVKNFLIDERYKKLVEFLHKCWVAGLINPEVFTQDYTKFQSVARGNGDTAKVGFTWGWEVTDRFGNKVATQYASMPPLKVSASATNKIFWDYDYNTLNYGKNMVTMSAKSKNKDAAMKFINELYDPKVSMQVLFGSLGTNIADNGDGSYKVLPPADPAMDPGTWKWTTTWADNGAMYIANSLKLTLGTDMQSVGKQTEPLQNALNVDKKKNVLPSMFMKYSTADNNTLSLNNTNMMNLAMAKFSQWITKGGIDAEWDAFVKDMTKAGLPKNLEIIQKYYDEYMSKQK